MDGRSLGWLLVLAMAGTSIAGCIEAPEWLNTTDAEVTAMANKDLADDAAAAWNPDAVLVGVMTFELTESADEYDVPVDPEVGNGRAAVWWYTYSLLENGSASPDVKVYRVSADGEVGVEQDAEMLASAYEAEMNMADLRALDAWAVDSDAAIATAKTNESFRKIVEGFNATLVSGVAHHDGVTSWWAAAVSADGFAIALVDAATGELIEARTFDMDFDMSWWGGAARPPVFLGEPVHLEGEGVAEPGADPLEYAFSTTGPVYGEIVMDYRAAFPTDGLHWAILDEDGEAVVSAHATSWGGEPGAWTTEVEIEDAGDYVLQVYYMSGVPTPLPTPGGVQYSFVMDLVPGEMPDDDEDEG